MRTHLKRARIVSIVASGLVCGLTATGFGALAKQAGGSGYSAKLSSNKAVKMQQLICDPATTAAAGATGPRAQGAPVRGSTSVSYDPTIVTVAGIQLGTGYVGNALVEVTSFRTLEAPTEGSSTFLQTLSAFLRQPAGVETGYVQVFYHHGALPSGSEFPPDAFSGPAGEPGQMSVTRGYTTYDEDGVDGFDTHSLSFSYRPGVSEKTIAEYNIYADEGERSSGNTSDFLTGGTINKEFTLGPGDLSSATVRASLVPLPPAVWAGSLTLAGMGLLSLARRRAAQPA